MAVVAPDTSVSTLSRFRPDDVFIRYIHLKLAALGQPTDMATMNPKVPEFLRPLLPNFYQKDTWLGGRLCPVDAGIQGFLDVYRSDVCPKGVPPLPWDSMVLDRARMAPAISLPLDCDTNASEYVNSCWDAQGVLRTFESP